MKVEAVLLRAITLNPIEITQSENLTRQFVYGATSASALIVFSSGQIETATVSLTYDEEVQIDALMQTINTRLLNE